MELNEDVIWYIWKLYNTHHVLEELVRNPKHIWKNPSETLIELTCNDVGALQHNHNDLWEMVEDHNLHYYYDCVSSKCLNCQEYGFPCANLSYYGFNNDDITSIWKHANF